MTSCVSLLVKNLSPPLDTRVLPVVILEIFFIRVRFSPHSFRRGTATALGGIGAPDTVTRMIGLWATDANLGYTWASTPIVEQKMLEMAEWDGQVDRARGPLRQRR